jgi:hypothetical protein
MRGQWLITWVMIQPTEQISYSDNVVQVLASMLVTLMDAFCVFPQFFHANTRVIPSYQILSSAIYIIILSSHLLLNNLCSWQTFKKWLLVDCLPYNVMLLDKVMFNVTSLIYFSHMFSHLVVQYWHKLTAFKPHLYLVCFVMYWYAKFVIL